jgi:hypothetical protein
MFGTNKEFVILLWNYSYIKGRPPVAYEELKAFPSSGFGKPGK